MQSNTTKECGKLWIVSSLNRELPKNSPCETTLWPTLDRENDTYLIELPRKYGESTIPVQSSVLAAVYLNHTIWVGSLKINETKDNPDI